jgi:hypothetical protein
MKLMWRHLHLSRASRNKRAEVKVETRSTIIVWPLFALPPLASLRAVDLRRTNG